MDKQAIIKALRDTAQSASNSIASGVSGPVDLISAGLRGVGVPIPQNAVGGSQWMAQQGLTPEVQDGIPKMVGETLGMVVPAVGFSQPAQVAAALRKGGENLAAPARMNKQAGAIVWHGSPHKFDRFDASKIGTGEGAQAYGRGLYLAESQDVAKGYQQALSGSGKKILSASFSQDPELWAASQLYSKISEGDIIDALGDLGYKGNAPALVSSAKNRLFEELKAGSLYKVDLPDEQIARMLDWDKPLSQQAPVVRQAIQKTRSLLPPNAADDLGGDFSMLYGPQVGADEFLGTMNSLQPNLGESLLQRVGVPGVRYLDQGSRGAGLGTSNFVVFPGNENMLRILERNGQPLGLMGVQ